MKGRTAGLAVCWVLGLAVATLAWSDFVARSIDADHSIDPALRLAQALGFGGIPFAIGAVAALIALAITRRVKPALWTWTIMLIAFGGVTEVGRQQNFKHPIALGSDGCKTREEYLTMKPHPIVPSRCLHVLDEPSSPRLRPAVVQTDGCKTTEEYLRIKPVFIPDECAYVVGLGKPPAAGQPDYTEGPEPGLVWADRLPTQRGAPDHSPQMYENCLRRLVKDAKTSEAAKIGERFCQGQYKPGLFDRLFK